jgi:hypothetical protein
VQSPYVGRIGENLTALPVRFWLGQHFEIAGLSTTRSRNLYKSSESFILRETSHLF